VKVEIKENSKDTILIVN